jgi:protease-4
MWTGAKSIELGLADAYGTTDYVAREVIKAEDILDYTVRPNFAQQFAQKFGASMGEGVASMLTRLSLR